MTQKQDIPGPVKMVAAIYLLGAVFQLFYFVVFVSSTPIAWISLGKVVLGIVAAIGLLKLISGWRIFTIIISGLGVLVMPFYALATIMSTDFVLFMSKMSGIESRAVMLLAEAVAFAMVLIMLICLMRPDVKKAFQSGKQEAVAT